VRHHSRGLSRMTRAWRPGGASASESEGVLRARGEAQSRACGDGASPALGRAETQDFLIEIASISTEAPLGSFATCTVARAGGSPVKKVPYVRFISSKSFRSAR